MSNVKKILIGCLGFFLFIFILIIDITYLLGRDGDVLVQKKQRIIYNDLCNGKIYTKTFRVWDVEQKFKDPEANIFYAARKFSKKHNVLNHKNVYFEILPWLSYIELIVCE